MLKKFYDIVFQNELKISYILFCFFSVITLIFLLIVISDEILELQRIWFTERMRN